MLSFLIDFFKGFIYFSAKGADIEGFLTYCAKNGTEIIKPVKKDLCLKGKVSLKNYKKLRKPARKFGIKLRIEKKHGFIFYLKNNRYKAGFAFGLLITVLFCIIMNSFIWEINVSGNSITPTENILKNAKEMGLITGTRSKKHFVQNIEWYILKENKNLSSVEINIQGSVANILVNEQREADEMVPDDDMPVNIVASKYGVIRKINVFDGQETVKIGDAVMKGDLLVSAVYEDSHKKLTLKHARANIIAEMDYSIEIELPFEKKTEIIAGKNKKIIELCIFDFNIVIGNDDGCENLPFIKNENQLRFFGTKLPIKLIITQFFDVKENSITLKRDEAKAEAFKKLEEKEKEELGDSEIISRKTEERIKEGKYIIKADYIILTDIAEEQPIESNIPWENTDDMS
ncbi:MAG: hypothetical protein E7479_01040 [Ruminococcaceae bacterium]|nr:hypothetical protein [Oscillospiraceae bacterium]